MEHQVITPAPSCPTGVEGELSKLVSIQAQMAPHDQQPIGNFDKKSELWVSMYVLLLTPFFNSQETLRGAINCILYLFI